MPLIEQYFKYSILGGFTSVTQKITTVGVDDKITKQRPFLYLQFCVVYVVNYVVLICLHLFPLYFYFSASHISPIYIISNCCVCVLLSVAFPDLCLCVTFSTFTCPISPAHENSFPPTHKHRPPASLFVVNTSGM